MPSLQNEADLLLLLKMGDPQAVEKWFSFFEKPLYRFVASKITDHQVAEEIVQETFINCLKHLPLFRGESGIFTWMCGVAKHQVADFYRKQYAKKAIRTLPLVELFGLTTSPDDAHQTSQKVKIVLARMTAQSRELLQLKYVDGLKVAEIACRLGKTLKSVESELFRARKEFRKLWGELGEDYAF